MAAAAAESRYNTTLYSESVIDELVENSLPTTTYSLPPESAEKSGYVTNVMNALFSNKSSKIASLVESILNGTDYLVENGIQILHVPLSSELLRRIIAPMFRNNIGATIASDIDAFEAMKSETFKFIPANLEDAYVSALNLNDEDKTTLKKWDERVKSIRSALAVRTANGQTNGSLTALPSVQLQVTSPLNNAPVAVLRAVQAQNLANPYTRVQPVRGILGINIGANPMGMRGGAVRNLHAPLYPTLVMNGGACPLALYGGDAGDDAFSVLDNKIDALSSQYASITGKNLDDAIINPIKEYARKVKTELSGLEKDLTNLRDASGYLAQNPLSKGLPLPADPIKLAELADKGREVTAKSLKLSRQFDKISQMEALLSELVATAKPRAVV